MSFCKQHKLSVFQALRYPYFHVGQALGAPLKYSEQYKDSTNMSDTATEPKPLFLYQSDRESPEPLVSQADPQTCSLSLHQPLQQIPLPQDNMEPCTKPAVAPSTLTEGQQEPLSLVKNRKPVGSHSVGITQVLTLNVRMGASLRHF